MNTMTRTQLLAALPAALLAASGQVWTHRLDAGEGVNRIENGGFYLYITADRRHWKIGFNAVPQQCESYDGRTIYLSDLLSKEEHKSGNFANGVSTNDDIKVSIDKSVEQIAKDIVRRLFPSLAVYRERLAARMTEEQRNAARKVNLETKLRAAGFQRTRSHGEDTFDLGCKGFEIEVTPSVDAAFYVSPRWHISFRTDNVELLKELQAVLKKFE